MSQFIYFIPTEKQSVDDVDLRAAGLDYATTGEGVATTRVDRGPGEVGGVAVCVHAPAGTGSSECIPGYRPDRQQWSEGPSGPGGRPQFWVGFIRDQRPTPESLRRRRLRDGQAVLLGDGLEWIVPRCWSVVPERPPTLPRRMKLDKKTRQWMTSPDERFASVSKAAYRFWMDFTGQSEQPMRAAEQIDLAIAALAVNYRLGPDEVDLLGLWGTDEFGLVLRAAIDADELEEWARKKKTEPNTSPPPESVT